jgi:WD40 repeat protein
VLSLAFSLRGDRLVSGGRDRWVKVWDVRTQRLLQSSMEHRGGVCAVATSPDGITMASACGASTIKFWQYDHVSSGSLRSFSHHESVIGTLAFSPDGRTLASGSEDRTVKLWNTTLQQEVASIDFGSHIRHVAFSPDNDNLAVVTDNGSLRLLRAVTLEEADRFDRAWLGPHSD